MERFYTLQEHLSSKLSELIDENERKQEVDNHFHRIAQLSLSHPVSKLLRTDQDWLNTERPLSWEDFRGRILVLDFFTYCCVNCLHVLPTLKWLEERLPAESGLVVVGVHSAKFLNEKSTANVANAILQNDITHCVVNDPTAELWNELQISCWPTLMIVGPEGNPLFVLMGESRREELLFYCQTALEFYRKQLEIRPLPLCLLRDVPCRNYLRFPGKVTADCQGQLIVLADTGNNRIVVLTLEGVVKETIGGPEAGFQDGDLRSCRFTRPQGVAICKQNWIYVADTENHAIRLIDLSLGQVTTVAGTGQQGLDQEGGQIGTEQPLSTPWDLCFAPPFGSKPSSEEFSEDLVLYIAMAGLHQIWAYFLRDCTWPKRSDLVQKGTCLCVAGSGREENRNNAYPLKASFAQPSGLTYSSTLHCLFVADSESSSVRCISLKDGTVKALVGGARDPVNLFAFGDQDGTALEVRLQHPLGVAWCHSRNLLYVADTYNHKVKEVDPVSRQCRQISLDCELHEPGGLCILGSQQLLVADTQAHALVKVNLNECSFTACQLPVIALADTGDSCVDGSKAPSIIPEHEMKTFSVRPGGTLTLSLSLVVQDGLTFSEEAPQTWSLQMPTSGISSTFCGPMKGKLKLTGDCTDICIEFPEDCENSSTQLIRLQAVTFVCDKALNVCLRRDSHWPFTVAIDSSSTPDVKVDLEWLIKK